MRSIRMMNLCACIVVAVVCTASALAQDESPRAEAGSPEQVTSRGVTALRENRIADFAALMHPEALEQVRRTLLSVAEAAEKQGEGEAMLRIFADVQSLDELRRLDEAAFFTSFLKGMLRIRPEVQDVLSRMKLEVIGHVPEGRGVVHVVYRGTMSLQDDGVTFSKMAVMTLKQSDAGWRMLMTGDFEAMVVALKQRYRKE